MGERGTMRNWKEVWHELRQFRKRRRDDLLYGLALVGVRIFQILPLSLGIWMGGVLGSVAYYVLPRERNRALAHLEIAFCSEMNLPERRRVARRSFQNLGKNAVELVNFPRLKKELDRRITVEGREFLEEGLARGRGLIWITGHLGNWELMACYMAHKGYPFRVVAREIYESRLNRLLLGFRNDAAVKVILRDSPSAGREMLKALKDGEVIGMLIDQDTQVKGVMADFFGRKANTPAGPAILARRRAVPVLAGFIHRVSDGRHRIVIHPPIEIAETSDAERDIVTNTERFNKMIERHIREDPEGWVWMHRRWRREVAYQPARRGGGV
jgi:Kdo2-lipid IVA lauroyltransferase/acyltransferase